MALVVSVFLSFIPFGEAYLQGSISIGLSIVKHAVQYHHGKIEINSEVGEGTIISISFPS